MKKMDFSHLEKVPKAYPEATSKEKWKNYTIFKRQMETRDLKSSVAKEIQLKKLNKKFQSAPYFRINHKSEPTEKKEKFEKSSVSSILKHKISPQTDNSVKNYDNCKFVSRFDLPKIVAIESMHYERKQQKLINLINADQNFSCIENEEIHVAKTFQNKVKAIEMRNNKKILSEVAQICSSEPKHQFSTCITHQEFLDNLTKNPLFSRVPPRIIQMSSIKSSRVANDDDYVLFDGNVHDINSSSEYNYSEKHHRKKDVLKKIPSFENIPNYPGVFKIKPSPLKRIVAKVSANSTLSVSGKGLRKMNKSASNWESDKSKIQVFDKNDEASEEVVTPEIKAEQQSIIKESYKAVILKKLNEHLSVATGICQDNCAVPKNLETLENPKLDQKNAESSTSTFSSICSDLSIDGSFLIQNNRKITLADMKNSNDCKKLAVRIGVAVSPGVQDKIISLHGSHSKIQQNDESKTELATDWNQDFQTEIRSHQPGEKYRFKRRTEMEKLQDSLRNKFASYFIREQILGNIMTESLEKKTVLCMKNQLQQYQMHLNIDQETIRRQTMKKIQTVKGYYEKSDQLQKQLVDLQGSLAQLQMQIFFLANDFSRRRILQNFQYLLMPTEWRAKFDNLHQLNESIHESIANRTKAGLWDRNNVTVWTIRSYFLDKYLLDNHGAIIVFESSSAFMIAFKILRTKSFRCLLQLHFAIHAMSEVDLEFREYDDFTKDYLARLHRFVKILCGKKYFMQKRESEMQQKASQALEKPLEDAISANLWQHLKGDCDVFFQNKFSHVNTDETKYFTTVEKFSIIENLVFQYLKKFDEFPVNILKQVEKETRLQRSTQTRQGLRSLEIQKHLQLQMVQLKRNLQPPQKMTRDKKFARMRIKKKKEVEIPNPVLTTLQEQYIQAFSNLGAINKIIQSPDEATLKMIEKIKDSSTPFYIDHLLEQLDFTLQKDFVTDIELRDGNEEDFIKHKDMLPAIRTRVDQWIEFKKIEKRINIKNTLYLYE